MTAANKSLARWRKARNWIVYPYIPILILLILFGLPLVGNFAYSFISSHLSAGCTKSIEGLPVNCFVNGVNIDELSSGYTIGIFLGGLLNPFLVLDLFSIFIPKSFIIGWSFASAAITLRVWQLKRRVRVLEASNLRAAP